MFAKPRVRKTLPPPPKKRKTVSEVEEVNFDFDARQDYLTGFHKRKLQRQKWAQDQAAKRERDEKIELRKQVREDRQRGVEEHVQAVNKMLREAQSANSDDDQEFQAEEFEEWNGIEDDAKNDRVDYEDEYIDEDRHTSVKVEAVAVSRDGLEKIYDSDDAAEEPDEKEAPAPAANAEAPNKPKKEWPKKKKQKFRYEQKFDRQNEARRQKAKKIARFKGRE